MIRKFGCFLLFAAAFAATIQTLPKAKLRAGDYPVIRHTDITRPLMEDEFFISNGGNELSHIALYHGIGSSIEHAREADILLIGNSRTQQGFSEAVLLAEGEKLGLRIFNLAVGHVDRINFALDIIRRYDLRPRLVLLNGDQAVFRDTYSPWATRVMQMSSWEARKFFYEHTAAWWVSTRLHHYVPKLDHFSKRQYRWVHYRSDKTGWWRAVKEPRSRFPLRAERKGGRSCLRPTQGPGIAR